MTAEPFILRVGSHRQLAKDGHSLQAMAAAWSELDSLTAQSSQILALLHVFLEILSTAWWRELRRCLQFC